MLRKEDSRRGSEKVITIPVMIDDVKKYKDFQMTRVTYLSIECDEPIPGMSIILEDQIIPFIMMDMSGIIYKPIGKSEIFNSVEMIDELFDAIESIDGLLVDVNDLWIPNRLLNSRYRKRSSVFRISMDLFNQAHLFRTNRITKKNFIEGCSRLKKSAIYSKKEVDAFQKWHERQIELSKEEYPKNKNLALEWKE